MRVELQPAIGSDGAAGPQHEWYLESVVVDEAVQSTEWEFEVEQWFSQESGLVHTLEAVDGGHDGADRALALMGMQNSGRCCQAFLRRYTTIL